jgi:hypothetical protein
MSTNHCPTPDAGSELDQAVADFVARSWEREVAMLAGVTAAPFVSQSDILAALVAAARSDDEDPSSSDYVVWVGGELQSQPRRYAARPFDVSISAYLDRLSDMARGREFTVLLANPHRVDQRLRNRVTSFARMIADHGGVPCGGFDSGIFLGRYGRTPFGIHRGQMSVLTFPILGRKRFLLWPRPYGEHHQDIQDSLDYDAHLGTAMELSIGPGDIGYWPSDFWHIADGPVAYSAALNIGMWWDHPPLDIALHSFARILARYHDEIEAGHVSVDMKRQADRRLPPQFERALGLIADVAQSPEMRAALELELLSMRSASGMRDPYPDRMIEPELGSGQVKARLAADERIAVEALADGSLGIGLLGKVIAAPPSPDLIAMLARLNEGGAVELDLSVVGDEEEPLHVLSSLTRLLAESPAVDLEALGPGKPS